MSNQIAALPEFYEMEFQNQLCLGNLVAMVTEYCLKISQHFIFASISVAIATTIISLTLYLVPQVDISALEINTKCVHISLVSMEIFHFT